VDMYEPRPDGELVHYMTGDRRVFAARPVADRHFYFPFALPPGERTTVYVRIAGQGSLQAPMEITTPEAHHQAETQEAMLMGLYGGALLALLIYNLMLYLSLRDGPRLYYVAFLAAFVMAQLSLNGMAFEYLWPNQPAWGNQAVPFFMAITGALLTLFSRRFLTLSAQWPRADRVMQIMQWAFALMAPASLLLSYSVPIKLVTALTVLSPAVLLLITAELWRRGLQLARYFLLAFGGLLVVLTTSALQVFNVLASSWLTDYGLQIGILMAITLLSFALAHRLKLANEAHDKLQTAHAHELESRVLARTQELDMALRDLTIANTRLQELTQRDPLTGLYNRHFLAERLPETWRQAQRWQQALSVLMIDVDHFKQVNDQHGHAAGDEALKQVAAVLTRLLHRPGDHAVRYGGEEFLVVLPQTNTAGAAHIAECIRLGVEALNFQLGTQRVPLTVSIGVACVTPSPNGQVEALLHAADQLLYEAKRQGRNRCVLIPAALALKPAQPGPASPARS
jgi:diguanylate cyclase (GGDEF)-like protein